MAIALSSKRSCLNHWLWPSAGREVVARYALSQRLQSMLAGYPGRYHGVSLAIPFVSLAAGALLAAACERHRSNHVLPINKVTFDLLRKVSKFSALKAASRRTE